MRLEKAVKGWGVGKEGAEEERGRRKVGRKEPAASEARVHRGQGGGCWGPPGRHDSGLGQHSDPEFTQIINSS